MGNLLTGNIKIIDVHKMRDGEVTARAEIKTVEKGLAKRINLILKVGDDLNKMTRFKVFKKYIVKDILGDTQAIVLSTPKGDLEIGVGSSKRITESMIERLDSLEENVTITNGMMKALTKNTKGANLVCQDCGLCIPKYPGRNPGKCPNCGGSFIPKADYDAKKKAQKVAKKPLSINQILGKVLDAGTPFPTNEQVGEK